MSLNSVPSLRAIANDIVFDVLLYLTPDFCRSVIECVTSQINQLLRSVKDVHPGFEASGGEYSMVGHSLGSVIVWDILSILKDSQNKDAAFKGVTTDEEVGYHAYAKKENANRAQYGTWGPTLNQEIKETINFKPKVTVLLGSPLGMFLTMRGAHAVFDAMRISSDASTITDEEKKQEEFSASPFTLPTGSLYNIFNPSDPVAYRVEPLLLPQGTDPNQIPPPAYLTAPGKDIRLHIRAKQFGDELRKSIMEPTRGSFTSMFGSAVSVLSPQVAEALWTDEHKADAKREKKAVVFPLGGASTRLDYSFQPGVIDNEYLSAVCCGW